MASWSKYIAVLLIGIVIGLFGMDVIRGSADMFENNVDVHPTKAAASDYVTRGLHNSNQEQSSDLGTDERPEFQFLPKEKRSLAAKLLPKERSKKSSQEPLTATLSAQEVLQIEQQTETQRHKIKELMAQYSGLDSKDPNRQQLKSQLKELLQQYNQTFMPLAQQKIYERQQSQSSKG